MTIHSYVLSITNIERCLLAFLAKIIVLTISWNWDKKWNSVAIRPIPISFLPIHACFRWKHGCFTLIHACFRWIQGCFCRKHGCFTPIHVYFSWKHACFTPIHVCFGRKHACFVPIHACYRWKHACFRRKGDESMLFREISTEFQTILDLVTWNIDFVWNNFSFYTELNRLNFFMKFSRVLVCIWIFYKSATASGSKGSQNKT